MSEKKNHSATASGSPPSVTFQHTEEFTSLYANNIRFEATVYDLKMIFGETDLTSGNEVIQQHTAVTIPWALVKVCMHFLRVNFEIHEMVNGKVLIPPSQIPPLPPPTPPEQSNDPNARKAREIVISLREEFLANL